MTTFVVDQPTPTPEGVLMLKELLAHVQSDAWPKKCCIEARLENHGFNPETTESNVFNPFFKRPEHGARVFEVIATRHILLLAFLKRGHLTSTTGTKEYLVKMIQRLLDRADSTKQTKG
jgi:hypothetical protein